MRADKFSFLLVCGLVIKFFIVALILAVCFMSHFLRYFNIISPSFHRQLLPLVLRSLFFFSIGADLHHGIPPG